MAAFPSRSPGWAGPGDHLSRTGVSQPAVSQSAVARLSQASRSRTTGSGGPVYSSGR